jgi:hypothetical protein
MKIIFYGASVTQQSGKSGYIDQLLERFTNTANIEIIRQGFPANSFDDAGFYCQDLLLEKKPDICFFEFSTTFLSIFNSHKLNQFIDTLLQNSIIPVFLILPHVHNMAGLRCIDQQYELSMECNIPILDLRPCFAEYVKSVEYLRDGTHTTEKGAFFYANKITNFINTFDVGFYRANSIAPPLTEPRIIIYKLFLDGIVSTTSIEFTANFKDVSKHGAFELMAFLRVGPKSNNIKVIVPGFLENTTPIFDRWTHYERNSYKMIISNLVSGDYEKAFGQARFIFQPSQIDALDSHDSIQLTSQPSDIQEKYPHILREEHSIDFIGEIYSSFELKYRGI